jgi:probable DNA metabolism protein
MALNIQPERILPEHAFQPMLFGNVYSIVKDTEKADRVWKELKKRTSRKTRDMLFNVFLSEHDHAEMLIFQYIQLIFNSRYVTEEDYRSPAVLTIKKVGKRVSQEAMRVIQFTRFQRSADHIFFAGMAPEYNVLPLVINHFRDRFADQKWVLYDIRRNYGYYYDLKTVTEIKMTKKQVDENSGEINKEIMSEEEKMFQLLWSNYYKALNIKERKNMKMHLQQLPWRYWKYLPEKRVA